jgi:hypothetical protein
MGNEVKVDKLTKFISTKYFNKLKFLVVDVWATHSLTHVCIMVIAMLQVEVKP